ncbi:MAG: LysR family transcriptional regulator [Xanthobacteraceae bacterium]|jgi:DNA-binding transcriptional LysR family regulator
MDARIRRRLRLRDLDTLIAVAETGSMAKAAVQLAVSQPAVSKAIAEMERTLGYRLLDRTAQGVEPNLYGQALLKWAKAVFDDVHQGVAELDFISDPTGGELRIGATEPIVAAMLPVILERLRRKHPRILFHVRQVTSVSQQQDALRERRVDLLLGRTLGQVGEDLSDEILFHECTYVVADSSNPLCRRRKIALRDLLDEPWSLPPSDTVVGALIHQAFRASGLELPRANVVTSAIQMHSALMGLGPYLAIFPSSMLEFSPQRRAFKALPVELPVPPWPVTITTLKNRTISPVGQIFLECAREVAKPLNTRPAASRLPRRG